MTTNEKQQSEDDFDSWDPLAEDYHSALNTIAFDSLKDPITALTGKVRPISNKIGHTTICERFAKYGECMDGNYCDRVHIPPSARETLWAMQNNCELNKNRIIMNSTELIPLEIKLPQDALTLVSVTNVKSPTNFYVTMPYHGLNVSRCTQEELDFYIERVQQTSDAKIKLQKCHEKLAGLFEHVYRRDNINDDIYLSQVVACKLKDGRYRRATVIGLPDFSNDIFEYELFLVDVGTEVRLPRELIYDIGSGVLNEPTLAINARLNIKPAEFHGRWSNEALAKFALQVRYEKYWLCQIISYSKFEAQHTIDLINIRTRESYTEKMIENKYAIRP